MNLLEESGSYLVLFHSLNHAFTETLKRLADPLSGCWKVCTVQCLRKTSTFMQLKLLGGDHERSTFRREGPMQRLAWHRGKPRR